MSEEAPPSKKRRLEDFTEDLDTDRQIDDDKFDNFVRPEELEKLREFKVLDEVKSNDEDSEEETDEEDDDGKSEGVPEDEIEKMLEEDLPEDFKAAPKPKEKPYITRQKTVLEEKGVNQFEVLPLDWMMVRHYSGMPVYMHRGTRVCTLAKPYSLGKGNTRRHDIPISAIPCLAYRRALEEEEKQKEIDEKIKEQIESGAWARTGQNVHNKNVTNNSNNPRQEYNIISGNDDSSKETYSHDSELVDNLKPSENLENTQSNEIREDILNATEQLSKEIQEMKQEILIKEEISMELEDITNEIKMECPFKRNKEIETNENDDKNVKEIKIPDEENKITNELNKIPDEENKITNEVNKIPDEENKITNEVNKIPDEDNKITNEVNKIPDEENKIPNEVNKIPDDDKDETERDETPLNQQPVVLPGGIVMPPPRVETVNTSWKTQQLTHEQVNDYCKKLFKFKTVNIMHFRRWADRRKYAKARKTLQYPTLPEGTKLITIPAQPANGQDNGGKASKRDWVMNMNGRSYLSVFHEYVRRALQKQPVYEFKQLENASSPYQATVYIGGMQYGSGRGSSKRQAKSAAARASIHILIPEMRAELDAPQADPDFTFFDYVGIEDPRISEFCAATCEPSPHAILRTCLLRNFGAQDRHIHTEMKKLEYQKIELTMRVGRHSATVVCKNKKAAKQRASQAILQALHPHVRSWGSLLRLYGSRSVKSCKEKKIEEQQITLLQDKARHNEPNYAVLEKLRNEMRKLKERDEAVVPIGTLLVKDDLPTHSGSNLNNVDL
ncbi:microprocessor complex subunit DGCR8 [Cydia pomonella]|uniref:microprocessor complex subunit DGCR8 n=1 Tax=Cydia pomonella TaxID=82600 RepID=UPI002ADE4CF0|nr:microprocessor complex subunit DGCR8 [Cydia pomonella]XP_061722932.1 microprocessor complex subunit DGCR8 [Cydia pomonella]XP_061722933.1 microprocessor complex subunit DGCR8 [Cydia pomonella]